MYFDPDDEEKIVRMFIDGLFKGTVSIDYLRFKNREEGLEYAEKLYENISKFQQYEMCPNEDGSPPAKTKDIYDAYVKGRIYGAIGGEIHDTTYEEELNSFRNQVRQLQKEKDEITILKDAAIAKLAQLTTKEPPMKKDYKAVG